MRLKMGQIQSIYSLMERFSKGISNYFQIELTKREPDEKEWFKLSSCNHQYYIQSNTLNGACSAFGYFIKHVLGLEIETYYGKVLPTEAFPKLDIPIYKTTPFTYRYNLNFCTFSYSMAFWSFKEWEKEIDQMAMHGINMMLNIVGQEAVYREFLLELGYTEEEVGHFICGPSYFAWFFMENMSSWGGPLPLSWYKQQIALGQKINDRLFELGMEPVFPGYAGMVPQDFKKRFNTEVIHKGAWCGFESPDILLPEHNLFKKVAHLYYKHQSQLFGTRTKYFGMDLFHEFGAPDHINLSTNAKAIQDALERDIQDGIWVMQGWGGNPKQGVLELLDHNKVLILDLWGESDPRFNETNEFDQTPWIWCIINNFGGKQGLFGNLKNILNSTALLTSDKTLRYCKGIGMAPEGIGTNPIIYQALLDRIWETDAISEEDWIKTYLTRRYGQLTSNSSKAWKLLLHGIYNCQIKQQGACESIICARPHRNIKNVTTWGPDTYYYDFNEVKEALKLLIKDYNKLKNYDGYLYDLVDIARQVIADKARLCYSDLQQDFHNSALQEDFLNLIKVQDALLSTREEFLLGNWLELAKAKATTSQEKEWLEFNARRLITLWGNEEGSKLLRDYACREWAGLTLDFYYKRWQTYFHALSRGTENLIDWYALEDAWTKELSLFTTKPEGDIQHIIHTYILTE